jgi:hypothetical protein
MQKCKLKVNKSLNTKLNYLRREGAKIKDMHEKFDRAKQKSAGSDACMREQMPLQQNISSQMPLQQNISLQMPLQQNISSSSNKTHSSTTTQQHVYLFTCNKSNSY